MGWIGNLKRHRVTLVILSNLYADPAVKNIQGLRLMTIISSDLIKLVFNLDFTAFSVGGLGVAGSKKFPTMLSYMDNKKYLHELNSNENVKVVFVRPEDSVVLREGIIALAVDDPIWYFFTLLNYLAVNKRREKSFISSKALIHPSVVISDVGVVIGDDVVIEPNVTILQDVEVRSGAVIRAGAVLGDRKSVV